MSKASNCPPDCASQIMMLITELVAHDLQPLQIIVGESFQQRLNLIEPKTTKSHQGRVFEAMNFTCVNFQCHDGIELLFICLVNSISR